CRQWSPGPFSSATPGREATVSINTAAPISAATVATTIIHRFVFRIIVSPSVNLLAGRDQPRAGFLPDRCLFGEPEFSRHYHDRGFLLLLPGQSRAARA